MNNRLAKKYADLIVKEDLKEFLSLLLRRYSLTETARKCGLTRRTIYKLDRTKNVRFRTKMKILKTSIEENPRETLNFLLERSKEKTVGVLMSYLSFLYSETISQKQNSEAFASALSRFLEARKENFGLISDEVNDEVSTMLRFLEEYASELGITLTPESIETARPKHLVDTIPYILRSIYFGEDNVSNLAKTYNVPFEWTNAISSTLEEISVQEKLKIHAMSKPGSLMVAMNAPVEKTTYKLDKPAVILSSAT